MKVKITYEYDGERYWAKTYLTEDCVFVLAFGESFVEAREKLMTKLEQIRMHPAPASEEVEI